MRDEKTPAGPPAADGEHERDQPLIRPDGGREEEADHELWNPENNEYEDSTEYYYEQHPDASRRVTSTPDDDASTQNEPQRDRNTSPPETTEPAERVGGVDNAEFGQRGSEDSGGSGSGSTLGRREFLLGGVGAGAALGGAWWLLTDRTSGPRELIAAYIAALDRSDWEAAIDLYHQNSPSQLARISNPSTFPDQAGLSPRVLEEGGFSLVEVHESHSRSGEEVRERTGNGSGVTIEAFSQQIAIVEIDRSDVSDGVPQGPVVRPDLFKEAFTFTIVRDETGTRKIWYTSF